VGPRVRQHRSRPRFPTNPHTPHTQSIALCIPPTPHPLPARSFWSEDWADSFVPISSITESSPPGNATFTVPTDAPPVYGFLPKARFYGVNLLSELDVPGEYFYSRKNNTIYFYPPSSIAAGEVILSMATYGVIATTSNSESDAAPSMIDAERGARAMRTPVDLALGEPVRFLPRTGDGSTLSFVTLSGIAVQYARGAGVAIPSAANVTLVDVSASNHGQNGLNIAGVGILLDNVTVTGTGCAASSVYGGDEVHLTSGGNSVLNSEFGFYARWTRTYNPGIGWGGVGDVYDNNYIHNAPHNGMLGGGNNCVFSGNTFAHLCYAVSDSGSWYAGRSWVRRGQVLFNNTFIDIQNHEQFSLGYPSVQAIYLDDQLSGTSIVGNTFIDCQKGAFVGGGRDTIVDGNTCINSGYCVHVDNRGMNWQLEDCTANATWTGQLVQDLFAVNYTLPPYATAYPPIVNSLSYHPCVPVNITVSNNRFCNMSQGFIDVSSNDTTSWFDVVTNNTEFTAC
jgi:parallel beta-helix repeat protein